MTKNECKTSVKANKFHTYLQNRLTYRNPSQSFSCKVAAVCYIKGKNMFSSIVSLLNYPWLGLPYVLSFPDMSTFREDKFTSERTFFEGEIVGKFSHRSCHQCQLT